MKERKIAYDLITRLTLLARVLDRWRMISKRQSSITSRIYLNLELASIGIPLCDGNEPE